MPFGAVTIEAGQVMATNAAAAAVRTARRGDFAKILVCYLDTDTGMNVNTSNRPPPSFPCHHLGLI